MNIKSDAKSQLSEAVKSSWPWYFFLAGVIFLNAGMARAQLIDVNFTTNSLFTTGGGYNFGPTNSGAAVLGAAGDRWNGINVSSGTGIPLIYANGSSSPVTMTFTSAGGYNVYSYSGTTPFTGTPYVALMENYLFNGRLGTFAPQTITLSGLAANAKYTLVLYSAGDAVAAGRTNNFTVNGITQSSIWNGTSNTLIAGTDYVEFPSATSDGSGNLVITWNGNGSAEGDINGFQIVTNPAVYPTNILANPGFEASSSSLANWSTYGPNNSVEDTSGVAHSGTNFYKVYGQFIGATNYTAIYQDNPSTPGAAYSANGWAYSSSGDEINGEDEIWISVIFLDSSYNALALYQSPVITSNNIAAYGGYSTWFNLQITNQCSFTTTTASIPLPVTPTGPVSSLVAPAGTAYVRYQIVFQQGSDNKNGSMYFDDLTLSQTGGPQVPVPPPVQWNITWDDEFNGTAINTTNWTYDLGGGGWGNSELENYTSSSQNSYVSNGLLHIVVQQTGGGTGYTSARMKTLGLYNTPTYGRFQWRAALPAGTGMWPALWLLGSNFPTVGWPSCGEIDVVENNGATPTWVQGSLHSNSGGPTAVYDLPNDGSTTNFHIYELDWNATTIQWLVDGSVYETQSIGAPFNAPFFFIMNVAVGGNYVGNPTTNQINAGTVFPQQMLVDYVRVYEETAPLALTVANQSGSQFTLNWPSNIVCHLQSCTNFLSGSWSDVSGGSTNPFALSATASNGPVYYRLASP